MTRLVLQQHAGYFATLEMLAGAFRLILLKPGEAGAVERLVAFGDLFGERIGLAELFLGFALRRIQALLGLMLLGKGADLDHPSAGALWLRRRLGHRDRHVVAGRSDLGGSLGREHAEHAGSGTRWRRQLRR